MTDIALQVEQKRAEGLLGASDAACALGLSQYKAPLTLWKELRGEHVEDTTPAAVREAAEWGQALEPVIRGKYALARNRGIVVPVMSSVMDGWLRATPDGFVMKEGSSVVGVMDDERDRRAPGYVAANAEGLLQVKCRSAFQRDAWEQGVPPAEEIQCRVEMAVTGLPWNDCAVLLGGNRMLVHRIERDEKLEANILEGLAAFWRCVQEGKEPAVDGSDAWRAEVSARMSKLRGKVVITADDDLRELAAYWMAQRRLRKKHQEEEDAAKNDLLLRMSAAGATGIQLDKDSRITAYPAGARTDWKGYALSIGGKATPPEQFKTAAGSWALRAPKDDEE